MAASGAGGLSEVPLLDHGEPPDAGLHLQAVLRYRSATGYQDGNPLGVIDSDLPNIQRRLGLWRAGQPLPVPAQGCATPRLVTMELWCGPVVPGV